jgi:hypothetical protein
MVVAEANADITLTVIGTSFTSPKESMVKTLATNKNKDAPGG